MLNDKDKGFILLIVILMLTPLGVLCGELGYSPVHMLITITQVLLLMYMIVLGIFGDMK